jgi:hypothetical protein
VPNDKRPKSKAKKQMRTSTRLLKSKAKPPPPPRRYRGMAPQTLDLIEQIREIAEAAQPITGRGVGYKLFTQGLIPSMERNSMRLVYRVLLKAREQGMIPWEWIVDETRSIERVSTWADPDEFAEVVARSYRKDFWNNQPRRVQVWSEKGTVRGVLKPVLDDYGVGFNPVHGFNSGTNTHDAAEDNDGRPLVILYVGDFDPSGMFMSEKDLPRRFVKYKGLHLKLKRIALTRRQTRGLPPFPAADKKKDPRYKWFVANHGARCWELDAMDPNELRDCVEVEINKLIERVAWEKDKVINAAEQDSLRMYWNAFPKTRR